MRPNGYSTKGFLGPYERLDTVVAQDAERLAALGLTHQQLADAIQSILEPARDRRYGTDFNELRAREDRDHFYAAWGRDPILPVTWLRGEKGHAVAQFQVLIQQYRGFQSCPWDCAIVPAFASFDFVIVNRNNGLYFTGPALITHLIGEHQFFEGHQSFYRVDPLRAARVLELV